MTLTKYLVDGVRGQSKFSTEINPGKSLVERNCGIVSEPTLSDGSCNWTCNSENTQTYDILYVLLILFVTQANSLSHCVLTFLQVRMLCWKATLSTTLSGMSCSSITTHWRFLQTCLPMRRPYTWKNGMSDEHIGLCRWQIQLVDVLVRSWERQLCNHFHLNMQ